MPMDIMLHHHHHLASGFSTHTIAVLREPQVPPQTVIMSTEINETMLSNKLVLPSCALGSLLQCGSKARLWPAYQDCLLLHNDLAGRTPLN